MRRCGSGSWTAKDDQDLVGIGDDHIFGRPRRSRRLTAERRLALFDRIDLAGAFALHDDLHAVADGNQREIFGALLEEPPANATTDQSVLRGSDIKVMSPGAHDDARNCSLAFLFRLRLALGRRVKVVILVGFIPSVIGFRIFCQRHLLVRAERHDWRATCGRDIFATSVSILLAFWQYAGSAVVQIRSGETDLTACIIFLTTGEAGQGAAELNRSAGDGESKFLQ